MIVLEICKKTILAALEILNEASVWLVFSFILAGIMHNLISPEKFQRMLGNRKTSSLIKATVSGMLLPICSCGVIPLGLGLYYSGAYLGPTLAFMTATPIINPAAIILAYGLLGPKIATIYLVSGFLVPLFIGIIGNIFAGPELHAPGINTRVEHIALESEQGIGLRQKLKTGLHWGFMELGVTVSKYVLLGMLLAGFIIAMVQPATIQEYLGDPGMISVVGIAVLGAIMYVCAVGHIPFIAALVASGAAPGLAITFLMTGAATNLPELISIYKMIGKRAVVIYSVTLISLSFLIGYLTNLYLLPGFNAFLNLDRTHGSIGLANAITFTAPDFLQYLNSAIVICLGLYSIRPSVASIKRHLIKGGAAG